MQVNLEAGVKIACLKSPTGTAQSLSPQTRLGMLSPSRSVRNDHNNGLFSAALCWLDPYKGQSDNLGWLTRLTRLKAICTQDPCSEPAQLAAL